MESAAKPPSVVTRKFYVRKRDRSPGKKKVLLLVCEVKIRLQHLDEVSRNRKEGALKAAETRKRKKMNQDKQ